MDTRKASELEIVQEIQKDNYLIIETKEGLKRISTDKVGKVKTVNETEPDENGNIEVPIPQGFSGSWNDLKDKPFYEESKEVVALPETAVTCDYFNNSSKKFTHFFDTEIELNTELHVGEECVVVYDGKEYTAKVKDSEDGRYIVNNPYDNYVGESVDLPFGLYFGFGNINKLSGVVCNDNLEHTFEIKSTKKIIHKIERKYYTTVFYAELQDGGINKIYKDSGFSNFVTADELVYASENSFVILKILYDDGNTPVTIIAPLIELYYSQSEVGAWFGYEFNYSIKK